MPSKDLKYPELESGQDWRGNNAAFTCPNCEQVFIVSGLIDRSGGRVCPKCGKSRGFVVGGAKSGGHAWIEW